ncbi:MAG: RNA polymerase sigma factor [Rhodococcus sp.]|nr:RNA polymerase sigma factor [Rhodococcus sp. (in: high G+C Gram-positive bacteria)]
MTDAELLALCKTGDQSAFTELVGRYRNNAWFVCLNICGNQFDAEDALQEALTAAWQNLPKFRGESRFNTWLHRIAANAALAVVRRRKSDISSDEVELDFEDSAPNMADRVADIQAVRNALKELPEDFRVALVLREFASLTYAEIAEHQGVSVQTVKTRIHRGRSKMLELLQPIYSPSV